MNLLRASIFNFEHLDILRDSIGHQSKNFMSLEFAHNFYIQFRASQYITGLNRISEYKVIVLRICSRLLYTILSISIYYETQLDIRVKIYCRLHFLRPFVFNWERLDMIRESIGHPS